MPTCLNTPGKRIKGKLGLQLSTTPNLEHTCILKQLIDRKLQIQRINLTYRKPLSITGIHRALPEVILKNFDGTMSDS